MQYCIIVWLQCNTVYVLHGFIPIEETGMVSMVTGTVLEMGTHSVPMKNPNHHQTTLTKLAPNGLNWVTYYDCITWLFQTCKWSEHLTNDQVTQSYVTAGDINGVTPAQFWEAEECIITQLITESVPNTVLSKIWFKTNTMEIFTTLKGLYKGHTTMIMVDMTRKLQNTKCREDDDVMSEARANQKCIPKRPKDPFDNYKLFQYHP